MNSQINLFYAIILLGFINISYTIGQNSRVMLGFEAGLGKSNLYGNKPANNQIGFKESPIMGYSFGLFVKGRISNRMFIKTGLFKEGKGNQVYATSVSLMAGQIDTVPIINRIISINFPILLKWYLSNAKSTFIEAGGYCSLIGIKSMPLVDNSNSHFYNNYPDYLSISRELVEGGILIGVGKSFFLFEDLEMNCELRDAIGLTNLAKMNRQGIQRRTHMILFLVGVGYHFNPNNKYVRGR
jgi:hypothetical protein